MSLTRSAFGIVCLPHFPWVNHHPTEPADSAGEGTGRGIRDVAEEEARATGSLAGWVILAWKQALRCRSAGLMALHTLMFAAIFLLCYRIRFDGVLTPALMHKAITALPFVVLGKLGVFFLTGGHRGLWRFTTFDDLTTLAKSATLGSFAVMAIAFLDAGRFSIPRSILVMDWAGTMLVLGGLRGSIRFVREHRYRIVSPASLEPVLIVGASKVGEAAAHAVRSRPELGLKLAGFLDDDVSMHGGTLAGARVLGAPASIRQHAERLGVRTVLVPTSSLSCRDLRALVAASAELGVHVKMYPALDALLSGCIDIRPRDVDIHDLLCRAPVRLDDQAISRSLRGRVVMVTGAAGSIGSEICRQILPFQPGRLILLDHNENGLFFLEHELATRVGETEVIPCVAGITDRNRLRAVFARESPEVVFHAAAHKHVPLMEANPGEAVKNNVFGTRTLLDEAIRTGVEAFVMVSTDKAVNPTSVMGACKRLNEMYVQARSTTTPTRLVTVRFGNVLGSNGSVVPLFKEQIRRGGPVTVTHPDVVRYFMTIPEAAQLVLQAGIVGGTGEILVLDMGEPIRVVNLARDLIRLSGLKEGRDIEIEFTGLRPGEKLFEELYEEHETELPTSHPKIFRARQRPCRLDWLEARLQELAEHLEDPADLVVTALRSLVPEYCPARPGRRTPTPEGRTSVPRSTTRTGPPVTGVAAIVARSGAG